MAPLRPYRFPLSVRLCAASCLDRDGSRQKPATCDEQLQMAQRSAVDTFVDTRVHNMWGGDESASSIMVHPIDSGPNTR